MKFEPTQPGNPHRLTIQQHIFPSACIARFCDLSGRVRVKSRKSNKLSLVTGDDTRFKTQRSWDQWAEDGAAIYEKAYQKVADRYMTQVGLLPAADPAVVTQMFCSWNARFRLKDAPQEPVELKGIPPETCFSKDDEERCEKMGVVVLRSDSTVPARSRTGTQLVSCTNFLWHRFKNTQWVCVAFPQSNLSVPDHFELFPYLPLSPTRAFVDRSRETWTAQHLNKVAEEYAAGYFFCRLP